MQDLKAENERLRYIIGALVEWRDRPWTPKGVDLPELAKYWNREGCHERRFDEEIEKAHAETISVWDVARAAIAPSDRGETG